MTPQQAPSIWTWPVILTLCISILALAVAGASLTWQVISWRRSGPQVTVKTISGIGGMPPGVWFVGIEATNSGRLGTEIAQFGFQLPNGRHIQNIYDFLGQPVELPMFLAPGSKATMTYAAHPRAAAAGRCVGGERPAVRQAVRQHGTWAH